MTCNVPDSRAQAPPMKLPVRPSLHQSLDVLGKTEVPQPSPGPTRGYEPMEKTILCDAGAAEELCSCCNLAD